MSDISQITARLDALEAATQRMANANAAKLDSIAKELNDQNPDGLQAAIQAMANSLAEKTDHAQMWLDGVWTGLYAANAHAFSVYKKLVDPDVTGGKWPDAT